ncbi:hypothetical protein [Cryptosporangium phraense]|uniref:hypothetical protein n=1 Tax=Cryptosporangium phraense TaxID=2593070 RepID=UPI001479634C|nr:hypothetical protein [Cryptosporangium phraense]
MLAPPESRQRATESARRRNEPLRTIAKDQGIFGTGAHEGRTNDDLSPEKIRSRWPAGR